MRWCYFLATLIMLVSLTRPTQANDVTWTSDEIAQLNSLVLTEDFIPPKDKSNRVSGKSLAIKTGEKLFYDARLSGDGKTACASCHQANRGFTDGKPLAESRSGLGAIHRNTPSLAGLAGQDWFYWDGRRDSLWAQALTPIEATEEMRGNRLAAVKLITAQATYAKAFSNLFGSDYLNTIRRISVNQASPYSDQTEAGNLAQGNWFRLSASQQQAVNHVFAQIGKTIAAYVESLRVKPGRFDQFAQRLLDSESNKGSHGLTRDETAGLKLFLDVKKTRCMQCHNGPHFTNGDFHQLGTGHVEKPPLDFGRSMGLRAVLLDEFNCLGPYSDADEKDCHAIRFLSQDTHRDDVGAFKTPGLRGLRYTAPYFHDGRFNDLEAVIRFYQELPDQAEAGAKGLSLSQEEVAQLIAFLELL